MKKGKKDNWNTDCLPRTSRYEPQGHIIYARGVVDVVMSETHISVVGEPIYLALMGHWGRDLGWFLLGPLTRTGGIAAFAMERRKVWSWVLGRAICLCTSRKERRGGDQWTRRGAGCPPTR